MDHHERVSYPESCELDWLTLSPDVEFCGYSAPHPSETKIHLRIQMYGKCTSSQQLERYLMCREPLSGRLLEKSTGKSA